VLRKKKPYLILSGIIEQKNDHFVAICFELDIATQGKTFEEAKRRIMEAIEGYLEDAKERELSIEELLRPVPRLIKWKFLVRWACSVVKETTVEFFRHRVNPNASNQSTSIHYQPPLLNVH
jgi:predicted RNase H-like HicB family nuclease